MVNFEDSIAHTAHGYVHGERAKTYGHPRFDFTAIGKVWTGLLQDLLKEDAVIDPYRVAVLMTGLKLCRLVKSPAHTDSRIDTIGYMLTMERLDEPEDPVDEMGRRDAEAEKKCAGFCGQDYCPHCGGDGPVDDKEDDDCGCLAGACECRKISWEHVPGPDGRANQLTFSQIQLWFEPGETKYVNGEGIVNDDKDCGKIIVIPIAPGTNDITISPHPPAVKEVHSPPPELIHPVRDWNDLNKKWMCGHAEDDHGQVHVKECLRRQQAERLINAVTHNHEQQAPCMPGCPVWSATRPFEFTGEHVEMKPRGNE